MSGLLHAEHHRPITDFLQRELEGVDRIFRRQLASDLPAVNDLCRHVARYRGKMLRPTLTLLCGLAGSEQESGVGGQGSGNGQNAGLCPDPFSTHRVLAAVFEMIHMATLVHDDVLDEAQMRRSAATVNHLRGNEAAVLLGDYLISNAFHLCSSLGRPDLNHRIGATTNELCSGELLQVHHRDDWSIDEATYFAIIERKTASLIGLCCELGAAESGAEPNVVEALSVYGRRLGVAFQIQDDLLDLIGDEDVVGKSLGRDLDKGKLTLPIILCFSMSPPHARRELLAVLAGARPADFSARPADFSPPQAPAAPHASTLLHEDIRARLLDSGAVEEARRVACELVAEARTQLAVLPDSPVRDLLDDLATAVVDRRH